MIRITKHQKRVLLEKGEERMAKKRFNITGLCVPDRHYMVDLGSRLREIRELVDEGAYFVISRARQYGKTTILHAMAKALADDYFVVRLDFQVLGSASYKDENTFSRAFVSCFIKAAEFYDERAGEEYPALGRLRSLEKRESSDFDLRRLFQLLQEFCRTAAKPVVLMVDEIDSAQNNQVFLDFLAQLRNYYLEREAVGAPTFQSVILAGVYDVKNLKRKIRQEEEQKVNSPWITREDNEPSKSGLLLGDCPRDHMVLVPYDIAAKFKVNMSFSQKDIEGMLGEYEKDYHTGMDIDEMAGYIYNDTSGYPFLVSELCKLIDEEVCGMEGLESREDAWTKEGFLEAERILLSEKNTLFDSIMGKLRDYPELDSMLKKILFTGADISYNADEPAFDMATMFGFIKNRKGQAVVSNRIFETRLYNYYLSASDTQSTDIYKASQRDRSQFIIDGHLNMRRILENLWSIFMIYIKTLMKHLLRTQGESFSCCI